MVSQARPAKLTAVTLGPYCAGLAFFFTKTRLVSGFGEVE